MFPMIKIRIFTDFHKPNDKTDNIYSKCTTDDPEYNVKYCFTNENDYTHVLLINCAKPNISHIPKENVIGLAFEPLAYMFKLNNIAAYIDYAKQHIGKYYIGDKHNLPHPFVEGYGYIPSWVNYSKKEKTHFASIMISDKLYAPGNKYRHILAKKILETNLPIDIYGRGCKYHQSSDKRIKGCFERSEPYDQYYFHIAIENFQSNYYFSEKVLNPIYRNTIPIYIGCQNIVEFLDDSVIKLSGNVDKDMKLLQTIYENQNKYIKDINFAEIQKKISIKNIINEFLSS